MRRAIKILQHFWLCLFCSSIVFAMEQTGKPTIVFDFGGVMAAFDLHQMLEYCTNIFDMPLSEFKQAIKKDIDRLAIGDVEEREFWMQLAKDNGVVLPSQWEKQYKEFIMELVKPRYDIYALLKRLRTEEYRVVLFSNVTQWQAEAFRELGLYDGFSSVLLSYEMGTQKPYQDAYLNLLEELGIKPEQCIFVDDRKENIKAAQELGIKGVVFTCFEETCSALQEKLMLRK